MLLIYVFLALCTIYYYWRRRRLYYLASKINGFDGYPFIGSAYIFIDPSNSLNKIKQLSTMVTSPAKFWLGPRLVIYINKPEQMEKVLNDPGCLDKGNLYDFIAEGLGNGLVTLRGDVWRTHRRNINPCFSSSIINSYFPIMNRAVRVFVDCANRQINDGTVNVRAALGALSLDMICETTLGCEMNTQNGENCEVLEAVHDMLNIVAKRLFQPWLQLNFLFRMTNSFRVLDRSCKILKDTVQKILCIKQKEFYETKKSNANEEDDKFATAQKNVFIQRILHLSITENKFNDYEVAEELRTMLVAGYETTFTTVYMVFILLGMYPEYQEKVYNEICEVFPEWNDNVENDDLSKLVYLDQFIKESQRLFPAVPLFTRYNAKEMEIDGLLIPAGAEYILDVINMHKTQEYWKFNVEEFNPDNFAKENLIPKHSHAFLPFGGGPHICIGNRYAYIALRIMIVHAVRHFRMKTNIKLDEIRTKMSITLEVLNQNVVTIEKRNTQS